jgi:hypothetical protein
LIRGERLLLSIIRDSRLTDKSHGNFRKDYKPLGV